MKTSIITIGIAIAMAAGLGSCKKDDNSPAYSSTTNYDNSSSAAPVTRGTWMVSSFTVNGVEHADVYSSYRAVFKQDGTTTLSGQGTSVTGKWSMTSDQKSMMLDYGTTDPFNLLNNKDWKVISSTDTLLQLEGTRGDDGKETLELKKI
jgi:hypothetical protein